MQNFSKNKQFIQNLFNSISADYDKLNDILSFGLHRKIKRNLFKDLTFPDFQKELKILDLCTGTGDIAYIIKKKYPNANVLGIDFSEKMLEIAKKKHPDINFIQGDCSELPFEDEYFDLCTISFGLRNVENIQKVLHEIHRVLKCEGTFINLDLSKPNKFFNLFLKPYMYIWVSFMGKLFHGEKAPYEYLAASNETFPTAKKLEKIYKEIGFSNIKTKNYLFGQISSQHCKK